MPGGIILIFRVDDPFLKNMVMEEPDSFAALNSDNLDEMRDQNKRWADEKKQREQKKEQFEEKISAVARYKIPPFLLIPPNPFIQYR